MDSRGNIKLSLMTKIINSLSRCQDVRACVRPGHYAQEHSKGEEERTKEKRKEKTKERTKERTKGSLH